MSLWVDKHRPCALDRLHFHADISEQLKQLVRTRTSVALLSLLRRGYSCLRRPIFTQAAAGDFPHLLFYGPSGAGKKTRIMCFLRELFGPSSEKVRGRGRSGVCFRPRPPLGVF